MKKYKIRVLAIFGCTNPLYDDGKGAFSEKALNAFGKFSQAISAKYSSNMIWWELCNEANTGIYKGNATAYAALASASSSGLHKVLVGSTTGG